MSSDLMVGALRRVKLIALIALAALCLQGCSDDAAPEVSAYAELDAKFPQGRPGIADIAERNADPLYREQLTTCARENSKLQQAVDSTTKELNAYREYVIDVLKRKHKTAELDELVIRDRLQNDAHYQQLLAAQTKATADLKAGYEKAQETIRNRMTAPQKTYDEMKAKADAQSIAQGKPVRPAQEAKLTLEQMAATNAKQGVNAPSHKAPAMDAQVQKSLKEEALKKASQK